MHHNHTHSHHIQHHRKPHWPKAIWVLAVMLLCLLAWQFLAYRKKHMPTPAKVVTSATVTQVPVSQLPNGFPVNFPDESGKIVLQNSSSQLGDGRTQIVHQYKSSKNLIQNYGVFNSFIQDNGWTIQYADKTNQQVFTLYAVAPGKDMSIVMSRGSDGSVVVDATIILYK